MLSPETWAMIGKEMLNTLYMAGFSTLFGYILGLPVPLYIVAVLVGLIVPVAGVVAFIIAAIAAVLLVLEVIEKSFR